MNGEFQITERSSGSRFHCPTGQSVLQAMERLGRRCLPVGCRSGGCGLCKVQVLDGDYRCGPMSRRHASPVAGEVLACRLYPLSDLTIESRAPQAAATTQPQR